MSDRDEILTYLGLPAGATFSEIEHAYIVRSNSLNERLVNGDESARVELAALTRVFGRLAGRSLEPQEDGSRDRSSTGLTTPREEMQLDAPAWWKCYLGLLVALASVAALASLIAYLPHVYHKGGVLIPLALIVSAALLSIVATMFSEAELRHGRRERTLRNRGIGAGGRSARLRFRTARAATVLSRSVRWLIVPALVATAFLNFASLSGHWSVRK